MQNKMLVTDFQVKGLRVLLRVDFNVPLNSKGVITNDKRIRESLQTIQYLVGEGAKVIICSHLGRPEGKVVPEFSLKPCAERLAKLLKMPVLLANDVGGVDTHKLVRGMQPGDIVMMENLRFDPGEEANSDELAKKFASFSDIYCNDAFGSMHRAHASTFAVTRYLPSCIGFLVQREIEIMGNALENPQRPFVVIIGGAKIKDKITLLNNMMEHADTLLIGGAMAYTFLRAQGYEIGKSLVEEDKLDFARLLLEKAEKSGTTVLLPLDHVVAKEFNFAADARVVKTEHFEQDDIGMDIGPITIGMFQREIARARTIFWNGPMGVFEFQRFADGTNSVAQAVASCGKFVTTIVGGGDSASAIEKLGLQEQITHISTGGGASLKFMEGTSLPGLDAIQNKLQ